MEHIRKAIAENIRLYRKKRQLRQKDIAAHFGVAESTVSMWERGENMISADMFFELADFLGVSADALAGRTPSGVSVQEMELLQKYRALPSEMRVVVSGALDSAYESTKKHDADALSA